MSKVLLISDLHFGHKNILNWGRPEFSSVEDMHEVMIEQWNRKVNKRDTVIVLGDISWDDNGVHLYGELNGNKRLVLGNHDTKHHTPTLLKYFSSVQGALPYKGCILTHIPIHPNEFYRWRYNIHGHLHTYSIEDPRYINVNVDMLPTYEPVEFQTLIRQREVEIATGIFNL